MAGISKKKYRLKSGKEVVKWVISYRDIFGKQHTKGGFDTKKEAQKELQKYETPQTSISSINFRQIFGLFLKKAKEKYSTNTYYNYSAYYNKYLKALDDVKYSKVSSIEIQYFFDNLIKISTAHVAAHCLKFARAAVNYAIKHKLLNFNIFKEVEKIEPPKGDINHLSQDEIKRLLENCKIYYPDYYALLFTFIGTGAREGEILALNKEDFNRDKDTILISKQFTHGRLIQKTKTESSNREIFIFEELKKVLIEHLKILKPNNPLLFPNKAGGYIHGENFRKRVFYKLLEKCGIKKRVRLHDLRGSYIDMVLSSGLSIKFAQNQVGHSKAETTLDVYAKNNEDMVNNAQRQLNDIFSSKQKIKKCEQFVSNEKNNGNCKIFYFPRKSSGIRQ